MSLLPFEDARTRILEIIRSLDVKVGTEAIALRCSDGRVLASAVCADRDYPPFNRSARDGFACRSEDLKTVPARLRVIGETRAGEPSRYELGPGETVEIMTGAPGPGNADCVVMVEYSRRDGDHVILESSLAPGRNLVPKGSEGARGSVVLEAGARIDYPSIALLASVGAAQVDVFRKPRVAILSTGDEIVQLDRIPEDFQIRNSNAHSLAAQVERRGGEAVMLPVAADELDATRRLVLQGLEADMLLLSGGVSMGKYDLVEQVLAELEAEIAITAVAIQPGKPLVFGTCRGKPVFGLPGNPISTMVTFEVFARSAMDLLSGRPDASLPFTQARMAHDFTHNPALTRFLPARISGDYAGARVERIHWQGSGDLVSAARANCYLVAERGREAWAAGDPIDILPL